ncbi:MAG: retropepsin-like aspartic protease [Sphingobacteriaceae bacterium]|nr:retropepsin-like aspartic protease [Sphingobacteriaceae bacterium]
MKHKIPLQLVKLEAEGCHLLLKARWHDRKLTLVLDTGASKTVFDAAQLQEWFPDLALERSEQNSAGLGTTEMQSHTFELKSFKIGRCRIKNITAAALDLQHIQATYAQLGYGQLDGILGGDVLLKYHARIDYDKLLLILKDDQ